MMKELNFNNFDSVFYILAKQKETAKQKLTTENENKDYQIENT